MDILTRSCFNLCVSSFQVMEKTVAKVAHSSCRLYTKISVEEVPIHLYVYISPLQKGNRIMQRFFVKILRRCRKFLIKTNPTTGTAWAEQVFGPFGISTCTYHDTMYDRIARKTALQCSCRRCGFHCCFRTVAKICVVNNFAS